MWAQEFEFDRICLRYMRLNDLLSGHSCSSHLRIRSLPYSEILLAGIERTMTHPLSWQIIIAKVRSGDPSSSCTKRFNSRFDRWQSSYCERFFVSQKNFYPRKLNASTLFRLNLFDIVASLFKLFILALAHRCFCLLVSFRTSATLLAVILAAAL